MIRAVVIDDHAAYRAVLTRALTAVEGVSVVGSAVDGPQGVQVVRALRPDLVLLDLSMPGLDGLGVLRALADLDPLPTIALVTADLTPQIAASARGLGAALARSKESPVQAIVRDALAALVLQG